LAVGSVNDSNVKEYLRGELWVAVTLMSILGLAGCVRAAIFLVPVAETIAITTSLCVIVMISIILGALLPLGMNSLRIDPAHSSTTIQVIMDILGVTITCHVSAAILDSRFHAWLTQDDL
jgi:Mg/Co/Ni transporter MgtE